MIEPLAQPHLVEGCDGCLATLLGAVLGVVHQGQFHILHGCGLGKEVIVLEYETYLAVAQTGSLVLGHGANADTVEIILARGGGVETAQLVEQGGFA